MALTVDLPLVIINVQRGGPSTGLPTKTEQSDLLLAMYGRNGEGPIPVIAPSSPVDCFQTAYEASRIAIEYMTPVIILSDGYLANSSDLWKVPDVDTIPEIKVDFLEESEEKYLPYKRDKETFARRWVKPGTPDMQHLLTGLEKDEGGNISYDAKNHSKMSYNRQNKVEAVAKSYPKTVRLNRSLPKSRCISLKRFFKVVNSLSSALRQRAFSKALFILTPMSPD